LAFEEGGCEMNQRIRQLTVVLIALFAVLFVQLTTWQYVKRDSLVKDPRNNRITLREFDAPRGEIVTADGKVIAASNPVDTSKDHSRFTLQRTYPFGDLYANITGYYTLGFGSSQIERIENDVLSGKTAQQQVEAGKSLFSKTDTSGSVHLTVDSRIQAVAKKALGNREGSVVVMNPATGGVLGMYSNPSYDSNKVASHNASDVNQFLNGLQNDASKPLLNNAYQERYMPGSTFKVITTTVGLETGILTLDTKFKNEKAWVPPNTKKPIRNYGKKVCGGDLAEVFRRSCNIPFARSAVRIGPDLMVNGVNRFGFDEAIPFDLPGAAASTFGGTAASFTDSLALLAIHGFGQGQVQVTPLHMAMIASTVANGGRMMKPFIINDTRTHAGTTISAATPAMWKTPMTPTTAATLTQLMIGVATNGTASCCLRLNGGISVAAKTGTAQLNAEGQKQRSHAWIMAFAPAEAPRYAVAVFIKGVNDEVSASTGGHLAGPIAKQVLDVALALPQG
jgi:peptidoglycan glycosyltransferase